MESWNLPAQLTASEAQGTVSVRYRLPAGATGVVFQMLLETSVAAVYSLDISAAFPDADLTPPRDGDPRNDYGLRPYISEYIGEDSSPFVADGEEHVLQLVVQLPSEAAFDVEGRDPKYFGDGGWLWSHFSAPPFMLLEPPIFAVAFISGDMRRNVSTWLYPITATYCSSRPASPTPTPVPDAATGLAALPVYAVYTAETGVCKWVFMRLPAGDFSNAGEVPDGLIAQGVVTANGKGGNFLHYSTAENQGTYAPAGGGIAGTAPSWCGAPDAWTGTRVGDGFATFREAMLSIGTSFSEGLLSTLETNANAYLTPDVRDQLLVQ